MAAGAANAGRSGRIADVAGPVRCLLAPNPGTFTLDGTRTYLVGVDPVAVIDPGPADPGHLSALAAALEGVGQATVLPTHDHPDHASGAEELARRTGAALARLDDSKSGGASSAAGCPDRPGVRDGVAFDTSAGPLVAVFTPGHAKRHYCYHLPEHSAAFTGDLILGQGDTTWIGEYSGGVADYLASLDRLESLGTRVLYPGHGDPLTDPAGAVSRFRRHRLERIAQVRQALADGVPPDARAVVRHVYGPLPSGVFEMAVAGVEGMLEHLSAAEAPEVGSGK